MRAETQHETVELKVVTSYGADDGNRKNYENAVAAYEASTGNRVLDDSSRASEEWRYKVFTDFETGSDPDVLFFFTNADAAALYPGGQAGVHRGSKDHVPGLRHQYEARYDRPGCGRQALCRALHRLLGEPVCKQAGFGEKRRGGSGAGLHLGAIPGGL